MEEMPSKGWAKERENGKEEITDSTEARVGCWFW